MKYWILAFVLSCSSLVHAQLSPLPANWKYKEGDDPAFASKTFNDKDWKEAAVNAAGHELDMAEPHSYAWYRVHFSLTKEQQDKDLVLLLGAIDDADQTYINGQLVGSTGRFPPNDESAWDLERTYTVKKQWLAADNVLAIRVYNGGVKGGLTAGSSSYAPSLSYLPLTEFISLRETIIKDKHSYHYFTTSNGLIAAVYDERSNQVEAAWPHIFNAYDSGKMVEPFIKNIKLNTKEKPLSVSYLSNTHIIEVRYRNYTADYFCSFTQPEKILFIRLKGKAPEIIKLSADFEKARGEVLYKEMLLDKGAIRYLAFSFVDSLHDNRQVLDRSIDYLKTGKLLEEEERYMKELFDRCHMPANITLKEKEVLQRSVAILKMSQAGDKEIFEKAPGQILASLRPGNWAIAWVRDASYAIQAMTRLGMKEEAKKGLEFMLKATPTDQYIHYVHSDGKDYGIKVPYQISVTRYFGNGREESDYVDDRGPNIEIDDFGLFLTACCDYIKRNDDREFYVKWKSMLDRVANAIIVNIDSNELIRQDSGPWEHHLPGHQFVFTNAVCAKGLLALAELDKKYGKDWSFAWNGGIKLKNAIRAQCLVEERFFKGNKQDSRFSDHYYFDGASIELFANGLFTERSLFNSHMKVFDSLLRAADDLERGYIRFRSNDSYENQEWPFAGLRTASAWMQFDEHSKAKMQIDRITAFAIKNNGIIPEIISNDLQRYKGSIPMVGYGAGAYVLALFDYYGDH